MLDKIQEFRKSDAPKLFEAATLDALAQLFTDDRGAYERLTAALKAKGIPGAWKLDKAIVPLVRAIEAKSREAVRVDANGFVLDARGNISPSQANIRRAVELLGVKATYTDAYEMRFGQDAWSGKRGFRRLWLAIDERFGFLAPFDFFKAVIKDMARQ
jgi:hypothetical protein